MPDVLIYILKILAYFALISLFYLFAKFIQKCELAHDFSRKNILLIAISILIISSLFGIYSVICSKYPYESDRLNYAFRFQDDSLTESVKSVESVGLYYLEIFLHFFSHDPNVLFFTCTFLSVSLILISYTLKNNKDPKELLLLGLSPLYFIYGFIALKQFISIALIFLAYSFLTRNKKIPAVLCTIFACLFHESALIVVPLFIVFTLSKKNLFRHIYITCLLLLLLFFPLIANFFTRALLNIAPALKIQLNAYINTEGNFIINYNLLTIFKNIPFYLITLYAITGRKKFTTIEKFPQKTTLLISGCVVMLLSMYMYWMFRFSLYIYPFMFSFFIEMLNNTENKKLKKYMFLTIFVFFSTLTTITLSQYFFTYGGF